MRVSLQSVRHEREGLGRCREFNAVSDSSGRGAYTATCIRETANFIADSGKWCLAGPLRRFIIPVLAHGFSCLPDICVDSIYVYPACFSDSGGRAIGWPWGGLPEFTNERKDRGNVRISKNQRARNNGWLHACCMLSCFPFTAGTPPQLLSWQISNAKAGLSQLLLWEISKLSGLVGASQ